MSWRNEKSAKRGSCWMRCLCIPEARGGNGHDGQESILIDFAELLMPCQKRESGIEPSFDYLTFLSIGEDKGEVTGLDGVGGGGACCPSCPKVEYSRYEL